MKRKEYWLRLLNDPHDYEILENQTRLYNEIEDLAVTKGQRSLTADLVVRKESRLLEEIPPDILHKLYEVISDPLLTDNNKKADTICHLLNPRGLVELGVGTNRIAFKKGKWCYKVALDSRGITDNSYEFDIAYESRYVYGIGMGELPGCAGTAKTYETVGIVDTSEYCNLMTIDEFNKLKSYIARQQEEFSRYYVTKDMGLTPKNYCNWATNSKGEVVCIDFAYMYRIRGNEHALICSCGKPIKVDGSYMRYKCTNSSCGLVYSPSEIINRMDIHPIDAPGYIINSLIRKGLTVKEALSIFGDESTNAVKIDIDAIDGGYDNNEPGKDEEVDSIVTEDDDVLKDEEGVEAEDASDMIDDWDYATISEEDWLNANDKFDSSNILNDKRYRDMVD